MGKFSGMSQNWEVNQAIITVLSVSQSLLKPQNQTINQTATAQKQTLHLMRYGSVKDSSQTPAYTMSPTQALSEERPSCGNTFVPNAGCRSTKRSSIIMKTVTSVPTKTKPDCHNQYRSGQPYPKDPPDPDYSTLSWTMIGL